MRSSFSSGLTLSSELSLPAPSLPSLCHSFKSLQRQHLGPVTENRWVLLPPLWAPGDLCPAGGWGGGKGSVLLQPNDMLTAFFPVCVQGIPVIRTHPVSVQSFSSRMDFPISKSSSDFLMLSLGPIIFLVIMIFLL